MLRLTSRITLGQYTFNNCVEIEIESSWNQLTDTCTITIPRKVKWEGKDLAAGNNPAISVGDPVKIELGYNFQYSTYFEGYVTSISVKTPVTIECQDAFWFLKQCSGSFTLGKNSTLKNVIDEVKKIYNASQIKSKYGVDLLFTPTDTTIGSFRADRVSMAFVLSSLKDKLGIVSFSRDNTIYSGLAYYDNQSSQVQRIFNYNIISDTLEYRKAEDIKIKLVVKSVDKKNLAPVEVGDSDGDTRTYYVAGMTSQAQMREVGERELPRYKYTGWFGSFTTFGDVFIKHGDVVELVDKIIADRNGKFLVKKVTTIFGVNGFRNTVELDRQANG